MNKTIRETTQFVSDVSSTEFSSEVDVAVCPPFLSVPAAVHGFSGSSVGVGVQDVSVHDSGAYTGDVSVEMAREAGAKYVIVGHSERREYHNETDSIVNAKVKQVVNAGLTAIMCVGESLSIRQNGGYMAHVAEQLRAGLAGLPLNDIQDSVVIAYEPIWAIGTGEVASPEQAQEVHHGIRDTLAGLSDTATSNAIRVLYGGSVKPDNIEDLVSQPDIDGALVGGASLTPESFSSLVTRSASLVVR